eukprot:6803804-Prymnesium_polylepis.1
MPQEAVCVLVAGLRGGIDYPSCSQNRSVYRCTIHTIHTISYDLVRYYTDRPDRFAHPNFPSNK